MRTTVCRNPRQAEHRRGCRSVGESGCARAGGSPTVAPHMPVGVVDRTDFGPGLDRMSEVASQVAPQDSVQNLDLEERRGI